MVGEEKLNFEWEKYWIWNQKAYISTYIVYEFGLLISFLWVLFSSVMTKLYDTKNFIDPGAMTSFNKLNDVYKNST